MAVGYSATTPFPFDLGAWFGQRAQTLFSCAGPQGFREMALPGGVAGGRQFRNDGDLPSLAGQGGQARH